jgi:predicted Zn-dependent protease with MMP-like domain
MMMPHTRFERLVLRALAGLPREFRERLDNIDVIVERRPSRADLERAGLPPGETLLGLYLGTPLTARTGDYTMTLPDRIIIFQEPIEAVSANTHELVEQVRRTVIHELAHHFGIDDDRLEELGAY